MASILWAGWRCRHRPGIRVGMVSQMGVGEKGGGGSVFFFDFIFRIVCFARWFSTESCAEFGWSGVAAYYAPKEALKSKEGPHHFVCSVRSGNPKGAKTHGNSCSYNWNVCFPKKIWYTAYTATGNLGFELELVNLPWKAERMWITSGIQSKINIGISGNPKWFLSKYI